MARIETAEDSGLMVMPLPGEDPQQWQGLIEQAAASLRMSGWLGDARGEETRLRQEHDDLQSQKQIDQAARQNLNRAVYRWLLGSETSPATRPSAGR